jgi:ankyrin repeat protein
VFTARLLARGRDPNRPDWLGKTFLHVCAASGNQSVAAVILDAGADINARGLEFNETPLAAAVRSGLGSQEPKLAQRRRRMVELLLKRDAATNLPDDEPWATPLAWARKLGLADIEEILVKHRATGSPIQLDRGTQVLRRSTKSSLLSGASVPPEQLIFNAVAKNDADAIESLLADDATLM